MDLQRLLLDDDLHGTTVKSEELGNRTIFLYLLDIAMFLHGHEIAMVAQEARPFHPPLAFDSFKAYTRERQNPSKYLNQDFADSAKTTWQLE